MLCKPHLDLTKRKNPKFSCSSVQCQLGSEPKAPRVDFMPTGWNRVLIKDIWWDLSSRVNWRPQQDCNQPQLCFPLLCILLSMPSLQKEDNDPTQVGMLSGKITNTASVGKKDLKKGQKERKWFENCEITLKLKKSKMFKCRKRHLF